MRSGNSRRSDAEWRFAAALSAAVLAGCGNGGEADALLVDYQRHLARDDGLTVSLISGT